MFSLRLLAHGGSLGVQTHDAWQWLFVLVPVAAAVAVVARLALRSRGRTERRRLQTVGGVAIWAVAGAGIAVYSLTLAFLGFIWDVDWHADTGRDLELFTVPHTLIVIGLAGVFTAGVVAVVLATRRQAETALHIRRLRVPTSAIPVLLLGGAALVGFPLDDFWHATYGIDVTMWSPTHLLMIGGASLTPLAVWLMLAEGGARASRVGRPLWIVMAGLTLVGFSTFQLEYDLGIPQWQMLFQPVLIVIAAGFCLVAARVAGGRGAALLAAQVFVVVRAGIALFLADGLGEALPRFPLYAAEALVVEAVWLLLPSLPPLLRSGLAGLLIAAAGGAAEWGWTHAWYPYPWQSGLLAYAWMVAVAAVAAAVLGQAAGAVLAGRSAREGMRAAAVVPALAALGLMVALHLPLRSSDGTVLTVSAQPTAQTFATVDAARAPATGRWWSISVDVHPGSATSGADRFDVVEWQGHAPATRTPLRETAPGHWVGETMVPVGGSWKSLVILGHGDVLEGVAVAMPAEADAGLPAIYPPAQPRTAAAVHSDQLFMREVHGAAAWPFVVVVTLFATAVITWAVSLAVATAAVGRGTGATAEVTGTRRRTAQLSAAR